MKKRIERFFVMLAVLSVFSGYFGIAAQAQFATPVVDGAIGANEYGSHVDGQNQRGTSTGQTWFMTWDDANLYVAVTSANLAEAAVIYIDRNPISPPNGGNDADGNLAGNNYDNTSFSALPFRADFVAYIKNDYREYRTANGANGWSNATAGFGAYASGAGNVRELSIPWSAITGGGRPASFNFFAYITSPGGFVFGQVPQGNAGGQIGTSAAYNRYFAVVNTTNGSATKPFSLDSAVTSNDINYDALRHDTFDSNYRSPFGAAPTGSQVTLRFRTALGDVSGVFAKVYAYNPATNTTADPVEFPLAFLENRTKNGTAYDVYSATLTLPAQPAIWYYKFRVADGNSTAFYSDAYQNDHDNLGQGGDGAATPGEPFPAFQLTVYKSDFSTPAWLQNASVYQIFPDRFRNGSIANDWCREGNTTGCPSLYGGAPSANIIQTTWNALMADPRATGNNNAYSAQFYGGDLKGIEEKLDYIKGMGFDTIYLNPVFKARSNHRYDADDYLSIAPELGGDAAFESLKTAAATRGMRLILDGVWNHMSQDSEYFDYYNRIAGLNGACESLSSPYRSLFNFFNNNVPCQYRPDLTPQQIDYEGWFGFGGLPVFNENDAVKDFFYRTPNTNVTQYWYDRGAAGWRFDVATDMSHQWWNEYRGFAKTYKSDGPLIGEIFPDASPYLAGDQLDSVMNYRFRKNVLGFARGFDWEDNDNNGDNKIVGLTPSQFNRAMAAIREDYPAPSHNAMLNLLDSHDTNRALFVLQVLGDNGLNEAKQRLKLAATFQFAYPGAPMVYYGDEVGINAPSKGNSPAGLPEDDPYNRAPYPWADETGDQNVYGPTDNPLINFYLRLGSLRRTRKALRIGSFEPVLMGDLTASTTDNNSFAFARVSGSDKLIVALNNGATANTLTIPVGAYFADGTELTDVLNNGASLTVNNGNVTVTLPPRGSAILAVPLIPTAAPATISGRVASSNGRALPKVIVTLFDTAGGDRRQTITDKNGFYSFGNLLVGKTYVVKPNHKRFEFTPDAEHVSLVENRENLNFFAR